MKRFLTKIKKGYKTYLMTKIKNGDDYIYLLFKKSYPYLRKERKKKSYVHYVFFPLKYSELVEQNKNEYFVKINPKKHLILIKKSAKIMTDFEAIKKIEGENLILYEIPSSINSITFELDGVSKTINFNKGE